MLGKVVRIGNTKSYLDGLTSKRTVYVTNTTSELANVLNDVLVCPTRLSVVGTIGYSSKHGNLGVSIELKVAAVEAYPTPRAVLTAKEDLVGLAVCTKSAVKLKNEIYPPVLVLAVLNCLCSMRSDELVAYVEVSLYAFCGRPTAVGLPLNIGLYLALLKNRLGKAIIGCGSLFGYNNCEGAEGGGVESYHTGLGIVGLNFNLFVIVVNTDVTINILVDTNFGKNRSGVVCYKTCNIDVEAVGCDSTIYNYVRVSCGTIYSVNKACCSIGKSAGGNGDSTDLVTLIVKVGDLVTCCGELAKSGKSYVTIGIDCVCIILDRKSVV